MNRPSRLPLACLFLISLLALLSAADTSPQAHQGALTISYAPQGQPVSPGSGQPAVQQLLISVHASYWQQTGLASGAPAPVPSQTSTPNYRFDLQPAPNQIIRLTFDGQPLMDANCQVPYSGTIPLLFGSGLASGASNSNALTTDAQTLALTAAAPIAGQPTPAGPTGIPLSPGDMACTATLARDPSSAYDANGQPTLPNQWKSIPISQWPRCGLLQAELIGAGPGGDGQIKPAVASVVYCPNSPQGLVLSNLLRSLMSNTQNFIVCLPLFLVLGLLMASMYYQGRNPLSLLDITTPRLPSVKKVRMKSTTQPLQIAYKARMANRVMQRSERAIASQIQRLYKQGGHGDTSIAAAKASAMALLPKKPDMTKSITPHASTKKMEETLSRMEKLINDSGAREADRKRAFDAVRSMMQVREALALDLAVTGLARSGGKGDTWAKYNPKIEMVGNALAKPWNFVMEKMGVPRERIDWIPGIPYVEKATLVATGWLGNRAGNIAMRQQLRRTLAAEVGKSTGMLTAASPYYQKHSFSGKKVAEMPLIVERLRNETHILGKAIIDEHLRLLAEAVYLSRVTDSEGRTKSTALNDKGLRDYQRMVRESMEYVDIGGERKQVLNRVQLAKLLSDYIEKNKLQLFGPDGRARSVEESRQLAKDFVSNYIQKAYELLEKSDREAALQARLPSLDPKLKLDPTSTYARYNDMVRLLEESSHASDWRNGRVPMVALGHDIADVLGRGLAQNRPHLFAHEGERLLHIRLSMEEQVLRKKLFDSVLASAQRGENISPADLRKQLASGGRLSVEQLRGDMDYSMRGEWAARNFLTAYKPVTTAYTAEAERNRLIILRQQMAIQFDKGFEDLFQHYGSTVERNRLQYHVLAAWAQFQNKREWTADDYASLQKRGVLYSDVQKGAWLIGADRSMLPIPTSLSRDDYGRITGAQFQLDPKNSNRFRYDISGYGTMLISDYAERPVNGQWLFRDRDGKWRPGFATDRDTMMLANQLKHYQEQLTEAKYAKAGGHGAHGAVLDEKARAQQEKILRQNIAQTLKLLNERVQFTTRTAMLDSPDISGITASPLTRGFARANSFVERVARGGIHNIDERLNEWYASQAYARLVMETFSKQWNSKDEAGHRGWLTDEASKSLAAKDALAQMRTEQLSLLRKPKLSAEDKAHLEQLRRVLIPAQIQEVRKLERDALIATKGPNYWADRDLKKVADAYNPFFNVAEMTVMRDPRIAFGGGHGMAPAVLVGYQTGQFVGERPQMWAGYHLGPGDRVLNVLARPAYFGAMGFGMATRSFFTKMTGYTTIYHMDPEKGMGHRFTEMGVGAAFQSLFRPSQSFDWLTRFYPKPFLRTKYQDEFGSSYHEMGSGAGERFVFPLTWKYGAGGAPKWKDGRMYGARGVDEPYEADVQRLNLQGLDLSEEMRRRKLGMTFREEYTLWDKRYDAQTRQEGNEVLQALRERLSTSVDRDERRMLKAEIGEMEDTLYTSRKAWNIPGVRGFFRQGYYNVENRAGYDISAAGGAHRPFEMSNPWFKNIGGKVPFPGMFFTDQDGHLQFFPRVSRTIMHSNQAGSPIANLVERVGAYDDPNSPGVGRDLRRESVRDIFRHETPFLSKFMELEQERFSYSMSNSPYIIPIAPLYVAAYQMLRKSSWGRRQPWSTEVPREKDLGPLTPDDQRREERMRAAASQAAAAQEAFYTCPTHGLQLALGQTCPLCRTQAQYTQETEDKRAGRAARMKENIKNWAESAIPFSGYTHYFDQAHCNTHGIAYDRGTACPLCLQDKVKNEGGFTQDKADKFLKEMTDYNKRIKETDAEYHNRIRRASELDKLTLENERAQRIEQLYDAREQAAEGHHLGIERDQRLGYHESFEYLKRQMQKIREEERKSQFRIS